MNEMVERVAKELAVSFNGKSILEYWPDRFAERSDLGLEAEELRDIARHVIAALREPTEAMVVAGSNEDMGLCAEDVALGWRAMIDAALADP